MENFAYLFAAFAIIWIVLFAYIFIISRRQKQIRREIERLKAALKTEAK